MVKLLTGGQEKTIKSRAATLRAATLAEWTRRRYELDEQDTVFTEDLTRGRARGLISYRVSLCP
jgi:hypothetical protein